jgi:hypothetical protein
MGLSLRKHERQLELKFGCQEFGTKKHIICLHFDYIGVLWNGVFSGCGALAP